MVGITGRSLFTTAPRAERRRTAPVRDRLAIAAGAHYNPRSGGVIAGALLVAHLAGIGSYFQARDLLKSPQASANEPNKPNPASSSR